MSHPSSTRAWIISGRSGFDSLHFSASHPVPSELGDHDVLVHMHYASLNYRDLIIPKGKYPFPTADILVPGSDGAGTVLAVGPRVTAFKQGDRVATLFNQTHQSGPVKLSDTQSGLGGSLDGVLRQHAVFEDAGLVHIPNSLTFQQASTLPCAALTAWNALYGLPGRSLQPGEWVLTQGTGGVSVFAVQFAKAAGARVISTTSSDDKADVLKRLGTDHVLNYKTDQNWGETAKGLTPNDEGVHHVLEIGGPTTMAQSLQAVRPEGVISVIGFLGGMGGKNSDGTRVAQPSTLDCLNHLCTLRGVLVGSREQFVAMNAAIDATGLKPVLDEKVWEMERLKEAYQYMWDQKHFGKVTVKIDDGGSESKL